MYIAISDSDLNAVDPGIVMTDVGHPLESSTPNHKKAPQRPKLRADRPMLKCSKCNYTTHIRFNLVRHEMQRNEKKAYPCVWCEHSFHHMHLLRFHVRFRHVHELLCYYCRKRFLSISGLKSHIRIIHDKTPGQYVCSVCQRSFTRKSHYIGHMNKHNSMTPFGCYHCHMSFGYEHHMLRHMKTCTATRGVRTSRHQCKTCNQVCSTPQNLKEHHDAKHAGIIHRCPCGKVYHWKRSLRRHQEKCDLA